VIKEGEVANLTLFDKDIEWTFKSENIKSKSRNYAFLGRELKGKAIAVFNKGQHLILN
jgi:dihydroorotase